EAYLQLADDARDEPLLVQRLAAVRALQRLLAPGKQREHPDYRLHAVLGDGKEMVERDAANTRHRRHVLDDVLAVEDEHRQDQLAPVGARPRHEVGGTRT